MVLRRVAVVLLLGFALSACRARPGPSPDILDQVQLWQQTWATDTAISAAMAANMDPTVQPCSDFHRYACGNWSKQSLWSGPGSGVTNPLNQTFVRLWSMMQEAAAVDGERTSPSVTSRQPADEHLRQILTLCTANVPPHQRGTLPMKPFVDRIDSIDDVDSLMATLGMLHAHGVDALFRLAVGPSMIDQSNAVYLTPAGLQLARSMYGGGAPEFLAVRDMYQRWMRGALNQFDRPQQRQADVSRLMDLEQYLERAMAPATAPAPPAPMDKAGLEALTGLPWSSYFDEIGIPPDAALHVDDPDYFRQLGALLQRWPGTGIESHLIWRLYVETSPFLPHTRTGAPSAYARCIGSAMVILGPELEGHYLARYGAAAERKLGLEIWQSIHSSLRRQLEQNQWLDEATRDDFVHKLDAVGVTIGYPDRWPATPAVELKDDGLYANVMRARRRAVRHAIDQLQAQQPSFSSIFSPVAEYDIVRNHITVPMAYLTPPQLGTTLPDELTYAGFGMIVAHELAHAFDSRGRLFDAEGRLIASPSPDLAAAFTAREDCLRPLFARFQRAPEFYSRFSASAVEALPLDVDRTMDEIFADVIGLTTAYRAYKERATARTGQRRIAGFEGDQLFFLAYAQNWCGRSDPAIERFVEAEDDHAPNHARVNGVLALLPEFAGAFSCPAGSPMHVTGSCDLL